MTLYLTYCSAQKNKEVAAIPAMQRYQSKRIERVYELAEKTNSLFYILSGKFGLLPPNELILTYDVLLSDEAVNQHAKLLIAQLNDLEIDQILYFTNSISKEPALLPYLESIQLAAKTCGIGFSVVEGNYND